MRLGSRFTFSVQCCELCFQFRNPDFGRFVPFRVPLPLTVYGSLFHGRDDLGPAPHSGMRQHAG
jgi:hypothetical protein